MPIKSDVIFQSSELKDNRKAVNRNLNSSRVNLTSELTISASRDKASSDLDRLAVGSARVILDISAVFPFNFFPDEIIADESKISIHTKYFFIQKRFVVLSIRISLMWLYRKECFLRALR